MGAKIFLSYPVLGRPELNSIFSLYQAILSCPQHKVRLFANLGESLISRCRNAHVSSFINNYPDCTHFMSIDSDLEILNAYPNNNIFAKLIGHDLDFVGGLYPIKKQGVRRSSSISIDGAPIEFDTGLKEMRWLSTGCWCIKRSAIEKMIKAYPELEYDGDDNMSNQRLFGLYIPMLYDLKEGDFPNVQLPFKKYLSEDYSFAERWRKIGGKIYADSSIVLKHIGSYDYTLWDVEVVKTQVPNQSNQPNLPSPGFDLPK